MAVLVLVLDSFER